MEAFVSRKRRKLSPSAEERLPRTKCARVEEDQDEDSTDLRLAILASLYPDFGQAVLLDALISTNGSVEAASRHLDFLTNPDQSPTKSNIGKSVGYQSSLSAYRVQQGHLAQETPSKTTRLTRKGQTLHLFSPEDIALHTPCSIIHNFLPSKEAEDLLKELLVEAPTFERQVFKLFDNVVESPHSACFYVNSLEEQKRQQSEYLYNGSYLTV